MLHQKVVSQRHGEEDADERERDAPEQLVPHAKRHGRLTVREHGERGDLRRVGGAAGQDASAKG